MGMTSSHLAAIIALTLAIEGRPLAGYAQDLERSPCTEDAMLIFDASGSMSSKWSSHAVRRIDIVREALGKVLPSVPGFVASAS
jgi:Ca-activated chloride channel family protein